MELGFVGLAGSSFCGSHVRRATCERRSDVGVTKMMADGDVTEGGNKPFGMFGQMGKIMDAMKKAQEFTKDAKSLQEELASTVLEATARDGLVKVKISGNQVPISVEISDELLALGSEEVGAACTEAVKEAHRISVEYMQSNLNDLTSSFGLPVNTPPPK